MSERRSASLGLRGLRCTRDAKPPPHLVRIADAGGATCPSTVADPNDGTKFPLVRTLPDERADYEVKTLYGARRRTHSGTLPRPERSWPRQTMIPRRHASERAIAPRSEVGQPVRGDSTGTRRESRASHRPSDEASPAGTSRCAIFTRTWLTTSQANSLSTARHHVIDSLRNSSTAS